MSMPFCALSCVIDGLTAASVMSKRETPNTGASIRSPLRTKAGLRIVWRFFFPQRVFVAVLSYEKFNTTCALFTAQRKNPSRRRPPPAQPIIDWINTAPYLLLSRLDSPRVTAESLSENVKQPW